MFIQPNKTKIKLKAGQPAFGVISTTDDPQLAELFGIAGFDYYMLDAEHGLLDPAQVMNVIRACESTNMTPMIRIGSKDPKLVLQYLDAGMMGIMMPGLETADSVFRAPQGIWHIQPVRLITSTFQMNTRWSLFSLKIKNSSKDFPIYARLKVWMHV